MELGLNNKHALVLGASQGLGLAVAKALLAEGASVTLSGRSPNRLEAARQSLPEDQQARCYLAVADLSDPDAASKISEAARNNGRVDILVNNTGGPPGGPAHTAALDDFRIAFNQHLMAAQIVLQAVLPGMRESGYGRVINVISTSVKEPIRNLGVSNTIRGAVASWAKTLAGELGPFGITVNNVLPGYTKTQRLEQILADRANATGKDEETVASAMIASVPAGRFADAAEIGAVIAFLASPAAGYVNGINVPVDGGRMQSL